MRLVEIRLLEGPNVYRLAPVVKVEVALGRRRTWYGRRSPGTFAVVRLGARVPRASWPAEIAALVAWSTRLRRDHAEAAGPAAVHRSSDPGHWIVAWPWSGAERSRMIAEATLAFVDRGIPAARRPRPSPRAGSLIRQWSDRIAAASATGPAWIRDADRRMPIVSVSGTNGKSTTSRLLSHILRLAGRHVGTTTSDGILIDERLVEAGDWTGPGGAARILTRGDVDVAVLETARGGIVLRGVGYESNEVSILTNVSSDHLDLQGIHTLPELAEVKATICAITRPDGCCILNADDPLVTAVARRVTARLAYFSLTSGRARIIRRHLASGGRAYLLDRGAIVEAEGADRRPICDVLEIPVAMAGLARHNVANALAAAAGARAMGVSLDEIAEGLRDFRPTSERSPGRLNLYRVGSRIVIVDFAHNEAGLEAILDVAEGIAGGGAGRTAPITAIIGTAGDRPDDTLRGIGRIAARRADRVVIKETLGYLRGRTREVVVGELLAGVASAGGDVTSVPRFETEVEALRDELARDGRGTSGAASRVIVLMCHEDRGGVFQLIAEVGGRPVESSADLLALVPRLRERARGR